MSEALELLQLEPEVAQFKATETVATGLRTLEFYAAAFSKTPDSNGDVIDPKAFDAWLGSYYTGGKPLPISFSHAAVLEGLDPTNVIGYAPANPDHVWRDDYGLRVKGFLDTSSEKGKAVEWQIENGLIGGASIAFIIAEGGRTKVKAAGGKAEYARITKIREVRECGPTPNPANQEAVLLWMKSEHMLEEETDVPYMSVAEFRAVLLKEQPEPEPAPELAEVVEDSEALAVEAALIEAKHAASPTYLQAAHDALVRGGAKCATPAGTEVATSPEDEVSDRLRRLRFMKTSIIR